MKKINKKHNTPLTRCTPRHQLPLDLNIIFRPELFHIELLYIPTHRRWRRVIIIKRHRCRGEKPNEIYARREELQYSHNVIHSVPMVVFLIVFGAAHHVNKKGRLARRLISGVWSVKVARGCIHTKISHWSQTAAIATQEIIRIFSLGTTVNYGHYCLESNWTQYVNIHPKFIKRFRFILSTNNISGRKDSKDLRFTQ